MQHRGEIVEKAVRQSGIPLTVLAKKLGKSRRWMYIAFENPQLSLDYILEIGKTIHHDFSNEIDGLKSTQTAVLPKELTSIDPNEAVALWKLKYYELLEKYNALLEAVNSKI
jgi:hypothetical protein